MWQKAALVHILTAGVDFGLVGPILLFLMWQRQWRCWWCLAKVIHVFPYLCGWMNIHWAALRLHPRLPCWQRGYHQSPTWWPWRSCHWTDDVDDDNNTGNFVDDIKFNDNSLTVISLECPVIYIYEEHAGRYDVAWSIDLIINYLNGIIRTTALHRSACLIIFIYKCWSDQPTCPWGSIIKGHLLALVTITLRIGCQIIMMIWIIWIIWITLIVWIIWSQSPWGLTLSYYDDDLDDFAIITLLEDWCQIIIIIWRHVHI